MPDQEQRKPTWTGPVCGLMGGIADSISYPIYAMRIRKQTQIAHPLSLSNAYKGLTPYLFLNIPSTIIQSTLTRWGHCFRPQNATGSYDAMMAFGGGFLSAIFATPVGNVIVQQQKTSQKPFEAMRSLNAQGGLLRFFRGFGPTSIRDSSYSGATFWLTGVTTSYFMSHFQISFGTANVLASLSCGMATSIATQPCDTLANIMAADPASNVSAGQKIVEIINNKGVRGFFPGGAYRAASICWGIFAVSNTTRIIQEKLDEYLAPTLKR